MTGPMVMGNVHLLVRLVERGVGRPGGRPTCLYFHHDRQDHGAAVGFFVEELAERVFDFVFDKGPI